MITLRLAGRAIGVVRYVRGAWPGPGLAGIEMAMARGVRLFLSQVVFGVRWHIALAFREAIIASRRWLESSSFLLEEERVLLPGLFYFFFFIVLGATTRGASVP